ncbi:MAG TPA: DUF3833 domain-containing protein [bacterium]|nr:DUF3833 domain-containing protein [bacterium]
MKRIALAAASLLAFATSGCGGIHTKAYETKKPVLKIQDFFKGHVTGYGLIQNRAGEVTQRFVVEMHGTLDGDTFVMDEDFVFDDGHTQKRQWKIRLTGDHTFTGTAADVTGTAHCEQYGSAIHLKYVLQVPVDKKTYDIDMDDWLYAVDEKTVLNRTRMTKLGFRVGAVTATFLKRD